MNALKKGLVAASIGAMIAVMASSAASAGPITFTWNPAGVGLSTPGSLSPQFTADNINISDYALITLGAGNGSGGFNNVTENAILAVTSFDYTTGFGPGFTSGNTPSGGASGGATPYKLYFDVTSTSFLNPNTSGLVGQFTSLNYTLYGDVGGNCTYGASLAGVTKSCGGDTQIALATGVLNNGVGGNTTSIIGGQPAAGAGVTIVPVAGESAFFVSPADLTNFDFLSAFTNNPLVVTTNGNQFAINGGGGNVGLTVPEPLTLSLFGAGLLGAGALRRRRSKKT
jgi:hypothetical protein